MACVALTGLGARSASQRAEEHREQTEEDLVRERNHVGNQEIEQEEPRGHEKELRIAQPRGELTDQYEKRALRIHERSLALARASIKRTHAREAP